MHLETHYSGAFAVARGALRASGPYTGTQPRPRQPHKDHRGQWDRVAAHPESSRKPPSCFNYKFPYLFNGECTHFLIDLRGFDIFKLTENKKTGPSLHGVSCACTPSPRLQIFQLQSQDKLPIGTTCKELQPWLAIKAMISYIERDP